MVWGIWYGVYAMGYMLWGIWYGVYGMGYMVYIEYRVSICSFLECEHTNGRANVRNLTHVLERHSRDLIILGVVRADPPVRGGSHRRWAHGRREGR